MRWSPAVSACIGARCLTMGDHNADACRFERCTLTQGHHGRCNFAPASPPARPTPEVAPDVPDVEALLERAAQLLEQSAPMVALPLPIRLSWHDRKRAFVAAIQTWRARRSSGAK
jgi:hypothetical protein